MAVTVWSPSPEAVFGSNIGADIGLDFFDTGVPNDLDRDHADFGSVAKGTSVGTVYWLFEIDEPEGTVFSSLEFSTYAELTQGTGTIDFWFGVLAKDGTWNTQPESSPAGLGDYALREDFPHPAAGPDAAWASGDASMTGTIDPATWPVGGFPNRGSWGSVGTGADFEDDQILTDFQAAFVANESDRTAARGVPVLLFIRPQIGDLAIVRLATQNEVVVANRPTLTLDATLPASDPIIYEVIAKASQINVSAKSAQLDVTAKADQLDVTAKPDTIEVAREE